MRTRKSDRQVPRRRGRPVDPRKPLRVNLSPSHKMALDEAAAVEGLSTNALAVALLEGCGLLVEDIRSAYAALTE